MKKFENMICENGLMLLVDGNVWDGSGKVVVIDKSDLREGESGVEFCEEKWDEFYDEFGKLDKELNLVDSFDEMYYKVLMKGIWRIWCGESSKGKLIFWKNGNSDVVSWIEE